MRIFFLSIVLLLLTLVGATENIQAQGQEKAPEIRGKVWFNAQAYKTLNLKALRGKVVLVFFWTSSDPNCETAAGNLNEWYSRYKEKGLEIIGIQTPEWEFSGSESDVFKKIDRLGIKFPVVMDEDSALRDAYGQQPWPSFCLVDREGYIRAQYGGLFSYRDIEIMLLGLLEEGKSQMLLTRKG